MKAKRPITKNYIVKMALCILLSIILLIAILLEYGIVEFRNDSVQQPEKQISISGWGDSANGRESYSTLEIESGILEDRIVFNSISDSKIGDEKNFVAAKPVGSQQSWKSEVIHVTDGGIYGIRLYLHNDNPSGEAAIAEDVRVSFSLPTELHKVQGVTGYISCSNANPNRYWDGVTFYATKEFYIEYLSGSAKFINALGAFDLSDEIITEGVMLGYSELDGKIPGGYEYDGQVSFDVIVHMK